MITAGIDVGSIATKAALFDGKLIASVVIPTGWNPKEAGAEGFNLVMEKAGVVRKDISRIIGTGYGRISLPFIDKKVTEITCHAKGSAFLFPDTKTVIDVGGQDCKIIAVNAKGMVVDFIMNDKCAAGTGRFLQMMAGILDMTLDELGEAAAKGEPVEINSMCTVFAESEIIGLLAQGIPKEAIAAGIIKSIASRIKGLSGRVACNNEVTFTGGLAQNANICKCLSKELGIKFNVPEKPQIVGALGAAILAWG